MHRRATDYHDQCKKIRRYIDQAGIRPCARWLTVSTSTIYRLRDHPECVGSEMFDRMWDHVCSTPIPRSGR